MFLFLHWKFGDQNFKVIKTVKKKNSSWIKQFNPSLMITLFDEQV